MTCVELHVNKLCDITFISMVVSGYKVKHDKGSDHMTNKTGHTHESPPDLRLQFTAFTR